MRENEREIKIFVLLYKNIPLYFIILQFNYKIRKNKLFFIKTTIFLEKKHEIQYLN
jgi:hypothetical protein